jgi:hypothetical protein
MTDSMTDFTTELTTKNGCRIDGSRFPVVLNSLQSYSANFLYLA